MDRVLFSSDKQDWETPQDLFDKLHSAFNFTIDVCANYNNHKLERYYSLEENGLKQDWSNEIFWMNPPYGREQAKWLEKAYNVSLQGGKGVCLVPARTDTRANHDFSFQPQNFICFIKGRLKFGGADNSAPFPSMLVVMGYDSLTQGQEQVLASLGKLVLM